MTMGAENSAHGIAMLNVCSWPRADIRSDTFDVRF